MPDLPKVHLVLTMADVYRRHQPDLPSKFHLHWEGLLRTLLSGLAETAISQPVHTRDQLCAEIARAGERACDCLLLLPMTYTPSGELIDPLLETRLPLVVINTAYDRSLPYDMTGEHLLRNQALHGVMDLASELRRHNRAFGMLAGHATQDRFRDELGFLVAAARGARVLQSGRIGRVGEAFPGMLDLKFDPNQQQQSLGFEIVEIDPRGLVNAAAEVAPSALERELEWTRSFCEVPASISSAELDAGLRIGLALQQAAAEQILDGVALNFLSLLEAGAQSLPFLSAGKLMAEGTAYAGEGDVLNCALQAALRRVCGACGFTAWYAPDYWRGEILLSHMGECNLALADPARPIRLKLRDFPWGSCLQVPVPVFAMRPGRVTLAAIGADGPADGGGFHLVVATGELPEAPEHERLEVPATRFKPDGPLEEFLANYILAGGVHHAALVYGNQARAIETMARLAGIRITTVKSS